MVHSDSFALGGPRGVHSFHQFELFGGLHGVSCFRLFASLVGVLFVCCLFTIWLIHRARVNKRSLLLLGTFFVPSLIVVFSCSVHGCALRQITDDDGFSSADLSATLTEKWCVSVIRILADLQLNVGET